MRHCKSRPNRTFALILSALTAIVAAACDGSDRSPVGPAPPTSLPVSQAATPGTYSRVGSPGLPYRFVIEESEKFRMQGLSGDGSPFDLPGTYSREGDWYLFQFEITEWAATVSFVGRCIEVRFNMKAQGADWEGGRFCPPPPPPPTTLPKSENATPGTYLRVDPAVAGSEETYVSRFEIDRNGTFRLRVSTAHPGFTGAYSRQGSWYYFLFDANKPQWAADVSFGGKCMEVRFSEIAGLDGFENGRYCR